MKRIEYPERGNWAEILKRPAIETKQLKKIVQSILAEVQLGKDIALYKFNKKFEGYKSKVLSVTDSEIGEAVKNIDPQLKAAILVAKENIGKFHEAQNTRELVVETMPGVVCTRKSVPIERVGLYIPGGTAPLFSTVLMLGIPAQTAGCKEVIICTPPDESGAIHPAILYAAHIAGISTIFKVGGVQAIGAMAYGTPSIPKVYKIFGPGNQYVTMAKQIVNMQGTAIDMPAGPSEVAIFADDSAIPQFVAADLLSQCEHGTDSHAILISTSELVVDAVEKSLKDQLKKLPRKNIAARSLENSLTIIVKDTNAAVDMLNEYGAEHLILSVKNADEISQKINNAGSVFIGNFSPESVGDYASGTNHTLPTGGYTKVYSGVSLDSFIKKITFQKLTESGLKNIGATVEIMAEAEGLIGHKEAVSIRLKYLHASGI